MDLYSPIKVKTYRSLLFVLFLMVNSAITEAQDPNFHIYLAFGQSNTEGAGAIDNQDRVGVDERFKVMGALDCTIMDERYYQLLWG